MNTGTITEERSRVLAKARRVLVKVGSAVLTDERGLNLDVVNSLSRQLAALHSRDIDIALVSSGAVAAGRAALRLQNASPYLSGGGEDMRGVPDRQAASAIGQSRLMHAYDQAFDVLGVLTAQILLTKDDFRNPRRFLNACNTFDKIFSWRVLPIINENDTVVVDELEFGDNDSLASLLLNLMEADLFVNLTSAPGVYAANPDTQDAPQCFMECIPDIGSLDIEAMCGAKTGVGSGGMHSKLLAARRAAQRGVPTLILCGKEPDALIRAFDNHPLGTWISATGMSVSRRKFRLAYNSEPDGVLTVDDGAVKALVQKGKSLLPAGLLQVEGDFDRGALVRIQDRQGATLGVGLCNYRASELQRIAGKKSNEVETILGYCYNEAIHRDNMLLGAAI